MKVKYQIRFILTQHQESFPGKKKKRFFLFLKSQKKKKNPKKPNNKTKNQNKDQPTHTKKNPNQPKEKSHKANTQVVSIIRYFMSSFRLSFSYLERGVLIFKRWGLRQMEDRRNQFLVLQEEHAIIHSHYAALLLFMIRA